MIRLVLALFFALCVAIFAVINVNPARVHYIFGVTQLPLVLIILGAACFGGLIVSLLGAVSVFRLRRERKRLLATIAQLEAQIPAETGTDAESSQPIGIEATYATTTPSTEVEDPEESPDTVRES